MDVITLHITGDGEPDYHVWDSDTSAAKFACSLIGETINNEWDLSDPEVLVEAEKINEMLLAGAYLEAVNYWNDSDIVAEFGCSNYYWIETAHVGTLSEAGDPMIANFASEDSQAPTLTNDDLLGLPRLIQSGATCRTCHTPNEYAAADKVDGTYVCRGCKGMAAIFAGS